MAYISNYMLKFHKTTIFGSLRPRPSPHIAVDPQKQERGEPQETRMKFYKMTHGRVTISCHVNFPSNSLWKLTTCYRGSPCSPQIRENFTRSLTQLSKDVVSELILECVKMQSNPNQYAAVKQALHAFKRAMCHQKCARNSAQCVDWGGQVVSALVHGQLTRCYKVNTNEWTSK